MKSVFHIIDLYVYPSIKSLLVRKLVERGLSITEVARLLGISKSLASRYLSGERGSALDFSRNRDIASIMDRLADWIINGRPDTISLERSLASVTLYVMAKKYVCNLHSNIDPTVDPSKCDLCPSLFEQTARFVEQAVKER